MPSLPSSDSVIDFVLGVWTAIIGFFVGIPTNANQFAKDHPEDVKIGGIVGPVVVAIGLVWLALPVLLPMFAAVGTALASIGRVVKIAVTLAFGAVQQLVFWVAARVLELAGFTANGITAGSAAASVQSVVYGPFTAGDSIFSALQSLGAIVGRLALAPVARSN